MLTIVLVSIAIILLFHKQLAYVLGFLSQALILTRSLASSFLVSGAVIGICLLASGAVIGIFLGIVYLIKDIF